MGPFWSEQLVRVFLCINCLSSLPPTSKSQCTSICFQLTEPDCLIKMTLLRMCSMLVRLMERGASLCQLSGGLIFQLPLFITIAQLLASAMDIISSQQATTRQQLSTDYSILALTFPQLQSALSFELSLLLLPEMQLKLFHLILYLPCLSSFSVKALAKCDQLAYASSCLLNVCSLLLHSLSLIFDDLMMMMMRQTDQGHKHTRHSFTLCNSQSTVVCLTDCSRVFAPEQVDRSCLTLRPLLMTTRETLVLPSSDRRQLQTTAYTEKKEEVRERKVSFPATYFGRPKVPPEVYFFVDYSVLISLQSNKKEESNNNTKW